MFSGLIKKESELSVNYVRVADKYEVKYRTKSSLIGDDVRRI